MATQVLIGSTAPMKGDVEKHHPTKMTGLLGAWAVGSLSDEVSSENECITPRKKTREGPGKQMGAIPKAVKGGPKLYIFGQGTEVTCDVQLRGIYIDD